MVNYTENYSGLTQKSRKKCKKHEEMSMKSTKRKTLHLRKTELYSNH